MTQARDWRLLRDAQGSTRGIGSNSEKSPIKVGIFSDRFAAFAGREKYSQWVFACDANSIP
jgi:hypothetical protein